eukprot:767662-Hanusia_phi.AAC.2
MRRMISWKTKKGGQVGKGRERGGGVGREGGNLLGLAEGQLIVVELKLALAIMTIQSIREAEELSSISACLENRVCTLMLTLSPSLNVLGLTPDNHQMTARSFSGGNQASRKALQEKRGRRAGLANENPS